MRLLGIQLRMPDSNEVTAAAFMATGLWAATVGVLSLMQVPFGRADAGALLLVVGWACLSARLGIRIGKGHRHLVANLAVSSLLLGLYETTAFLFAS
jgi:hypothetical protein